MWQQVPEPEGVIWAMCPPSKPWGFVQGTYTRPNHKRGYTLNEPGLVAKGEMVLAIEHQEGTNLWEHYEKAENGHWWPMSGHDMGALLCDPDFVTCIDNMDLSMTGSVKSAWDDKPKQAPEELREYKPQPVHYSDLARPRRGSKQPKGRAWWNH